MLRLENISNMSINSVKYASTREYLNICNGNAFTVSKHEIMSKKNVLFENIDLLGWWSMWMGWWCKTIGMWMGFCDAFLLRCYANFNAGEDGVSAFE